MKTNTGRRGRLRIAILADVKARNRYRAVPQNIQKREVQAMTLRTKPNRQFNVTFPGTGQLVEGHVRMLVPRLRRAAHSPSDFLADAILGPVYADVNMNLGVLADDFFGVASDVNAPTARFAGEAVTLTEPNAWSVARTSALDDEDEDEDEDDSYDDDLDEEDDEDLDDEDDEEYDDELDDEDGDLDDELDDEDEDDEDE
jgi:hypothetical protein